MHIHIGTVQHNDSSFKLSKENLIIMQNQHCAKHKRTFNTAHNGFVLLYNAKALLLLKFTFETWFYSSDSECRGVTRWCYWNNILEWPFQQSQRNQSISISHCLRHHHKSYEILTCSLVEYEGSLQYPFQLMRELWGSALLNKQMDTCVHQ